MNSKKVLLIGQAPSQRGDPDNPLASQRLANLADLALEDYLRTFDRVNIFHDWPGKRGKGDAFPLELAVAAADALRPLLVDRRTVFMGKSVAAAFRLPRKVAYFEWLLFCGGRVAVFPHPSGINTWWNNPSNAVAATYFMRLLARASPV